MLIKNDQELFRALMAYQEAHISLKISEFSCGSHRARPYRHATHDMLMCIALDEFQKSPFSGVGPVGLRHHFNLYFGSRHICRFAPRSNSASTSIPGFHNETVP